MLLIAIFCFAASLASCGEAVHFARACFSAPLTFTETGELQAEDVREERHLSWMSCFWMFMGLLSALLVKYSLELAAG